MQRYLMSSSVHIRGEGLRQRVVKEPFPSLQRLYMGSTKGSRSITLPLPFPRYCNGIITNSNSASAALNKWLKQVAGNDYVIHSFRHSMRDRLRAVNCPSDMTDQIGGWSKKSIGEGYGEGFQLKQIQQMMKLLFC